MSAVPGLFTLSYFAGIDDDRGFKNDRFKN